MTKEEWKSKKRAAYPNGTFGLITVDEATETLKLENQSLKSEIQRLKEEIKRLTGNPVNDNPASFEGAID